MCGQCDVVTISPLSMSKLALLLVRVVSNCTATLTWCNFSGKLSLALVDTKVLLGEGLKRREDTKRI